MLISPPKPHYSRPTAKRLEIKARQEIINELLAANEEPRPLSPEPEITAATDEPTIDPINVEVPNLKYQLNTLQDQVSMLKSQLKLCEESAQERIESLEKSNLQLKDQIALLETKNEAEFEKKAKELFKECLSTNQVDILLKKKTRAYWNKEELSKAFTLRYFSKRAYKYVQESMHYPIPGLSTLRRWAQGIDLKSGILRDVLKIMGTAGKTKSPLERCTVLSFDEMKISSVYEYEKKEDEIVGPFSLMQVVMARGLFDKWKQPVYIGFDTKMTAELFHTIVLKLEEVNFSVVACVCDCGASNQGLWKNLEISASKPYLDVPNKKEKIYFFADVPHTLKLLRNWFIDTGFILQDGSNIRKNCVEELLNITNSEVSSCHKLSEMHIKCEKAQRQNVRLAAQLFSNTTANAIRRYKPGNPEEAEKTAEFFQMVNLWFDIVNSYVPNASVPSKRPYGMNVDLQKDSLLKMKKVIGTMRCQGKQSIQVFQKAIILSIESLFGSYDDLRSRYNITYLCTHRLNQDCLENLFSQASSKILKLRFYNHSIYFIDFTFILCIFR